MAERTIKTKLLVRTDTTANWESENPILQTNEFGFDSTVQAFKKGDGTTTWNNLEYVTDTRLLKKLEKATDSDKLDGQDGSYYLNYNNLSNKPTIPNPTNYYWANVKVASTSNNETFPRFGSSRSGNTIYNLAKFKNTGTPVETILHTGIKWASGSYMPVIHFTGYAYGLQSPVEFKVGFYIYSDKIGYCGVVNMGSWKPTVYLFRETRNEVDYVAVGLAGSCYYLMLEANLQENMRDIPTNIDLDKAKWYFTSSTEAGAIPQSENPPSATCCLVPYKQILNKLGTINFKVTNSDGTKTTSYTGENATTNFEVDLDYSKLKNKPTIPTVNNGTLTIQKNGTNVTTFTANQSSNAIANITVPTKVSELTNDSGFTSNTGTVTSVKVGSTSYNPSDGVVTLPAYPEVPNVSNKVNGASSSTDNAIVRFDGTGGKTIQNSGVTIDDSNNLTTKGMIKIQNGSASGSFVLGADVNASTLTANQRKLGRMGVPSYDSTTKTIAGISFDSQANVNLADFGGHPNNTSSIAPDVIRFTVANEHNNSLSGTRKLALQIANQDGLVDSAGGGTSVKGAKFFIPVQTTSGLENTGQVSSSQGFVHTGVTEANRSTSLLLANGSTINTTSFQNAGNYITNVKVGNTSYEPNAGVISLPAYPTVPTKLSQLTNDSNFITNTVNNLTNYYTKTNTYTKTEVNNLINNISTFNALIVETLPSSNISTTTIYLISKSDSETDDYYDEYMYINNAWEMIGNTKIDLTNYYKKSETFNKTEINTMIETLGNELDGKANTNQISNLNERVYLVIGNTSGTAGTWTGTNDRITSYFDGLIVNYKIGVAGASTTTLNINGLGAKTVYLRGTTKVTTHYEVGTMVLLSYNASKGAFYSADYDANSYAYARQYKVSTDAEYPMLFSYVTTIPSSYDTNYTGKNGGITVNPSTGTITATTFKGNATTSTKAVQDGNGNVITETYATKEELNNNHIHVIEKDMAGGGTIQLSAEERQLFDDFNFKDIAIIINDDELGYSLFLIYQYTNDEMFPYYGTTNADTWYYCYVDLDRNVLEYYNDSLFIDGSNYVSIDGDNTILGDNQFEGDNYFNGETTLQNGVYINGFLEDGQGSQGAYGQVLTSTGSGVKWTTPSSSGGSNVNTSPIHIEAEILGWQDDFGFEELPITQENYNTFIQNIFVPIEIQGNIFELISYDDYGDGIYCSYCKREYNYEYLISIDWIDGDSYCDEAYGQNINNALDIVYTEQDTNTYYLNYNSSESKLEINFSHSPYNCKFDITKALQLNGYWNNQNLMDSIETIEIQGSSNSKITFYASNINHLRALNYITIKAHNLIFVNKPLYFDNLDVNGMSNFPNENNFIVFCSNNDNNILFANAFYLDYDAMDICHISSFEIGEI